MAGSSICLVYLTNMRYLLVQMLLTHTKFHKCLKESKDDTNMPKITSYKLSQGSSYQESEYEDKRSKPCDRHLWHQRIALLSDS